MRRKIIQFYSALLFNTHLRGFIEGEIYRGNIKFLCVPGLNCYSCPGAVGACPLGALQNALISANHKIGWYILGIIALYGVILGRSICGWLCPVGLIQELLHKIPTYKINKSRFTRLLSYLKYIILAVLVIIMPLFYAIYYDMPLPSFCKYICPAGTLGAVSLLANPVNNNLFSMLGLFFTSKFIIMIILAMACIFCYRTFCRFICPLGALYGMFNKFNIIGVKVNNSCVNCGACVKFCKMDVRFIGDHECINCGECAKICPHKAISFKFGNYEPTKIFNRALCCLAVIVLCLSLIFFNAQKNNKNISLGHEVGQKLENFTIKCLDDSEFNLYDNLGKIIIINLWATYCAPCVKELPYFDSFYREHENIVILAVHSSLVTEDPAEFLAKKEFAIKFAVDSENDLIWQIVGGSATLPQTLIINKEGEIIYNQIGSVTPEILAALYEKANL